MGPGLGQGWARDGVGVGGRGRVVVRVPSEGVAMR